MRNVRWIAVAAAASLAGFASLAAGQTTENEDRAFELVPYLGVATSPLEEALGRQLELPRGVGLRVDYVDAASPAAGVLREGDVLHKLDDQILVNHEQLAVLIRTRRAGDALRLLARRDARPVELAIPLAERRVRRRPEGADLRQRPLFPRGSGQPPALDLESIPLADGVTNGIRLRLPQPGAGLPGGTSIRLHLGTEGGRTHRSSVLMDGQRVYSLEADGLKTNFHVATPEGEVLFDGPVNTPEERAQVPPEFHEPLQRLSPPERAPAPAPPTPGGAPAVPGARSL